MKNGTTPDMSDQFTLHESALFDGEEHPIVYSREFNIEFECAFDLRFFPFDTQLCAMELKASNSIRNFIQLVPKELKFQGEEKLSMFYVKNWYTEMDTSEEDDVDVRIKIATISRVRFNYVPGVKVRFSVWVGYWL